MKMSDDDYSLDVLNVQKSFDLVSREYDRFALMQRIVADRLLESFEQLRIHPALILDLGSGTGYGTKKLKQYFRKAHILQMDISISMLREARNKSARFFSRDHFICANSDKIPLPDESVDIVFSNLMLQWCSDLDIVFLEIERVLKREGLFLFSTFGPDTLKELRDSWRVADKKVHVNAFFDMHDIGDALIRNRLDAPVLNVEHLVFTYDDCKTLMMDLKNTGAKNINRGRRSTLTGKARFKNMLGHYESFRRDKKLPATYEIVYGHAWTRNKKLHRSNDTLIPFKDLKQQLARNQRKT